MSTAEARPRCRVCGEELSSPALPALDRHQGIAGEFRVVECSGCGVAWTLPLADDEELGAFYPSETYAPYHQPGGAIGRLLFALANGSRFRAPPFHEASVRPRGRLLDVGCGRGDLLASFAARGWEVEGCDPSETAVAVCRDRGLSVSHGALADVAGSLPDATFDVVVYLHALEHVNDPVRELELARRLLAPGGSVLISVPNWDSWQRRLFRGRWFHLDPPRHRIHLSEGSLRTVARRAGLAVLWTRTGTSALGLPWSLQYVVGGRILTGGRWQLPAYFAAAALYPLTWVAGRIGGSGDFLHAALAHPSAPGSQSSP